MKARKLIFFLVTIFFAVTIFANGTTQPVRKTPAKISVVKKSHKKIVKKKSRITARRYAKTSSGEFDTIQANGNFNITVVPGGTSVAINCPVACVTEKVFDHTLMLDNIVLLDEKEKPIACPTANIRISTPVLNGIYLLGDSTLVANHIRGYRAVIAVNGNSTVRLNGIVDVRKVSASGNGNVSIEWVNSDDLLVEASDNAEIFLAGVARVLEVRLAGASYLNAKYLRPDIAFVHTNHFATADVLATKALYAFAMDSSNIYYYKTPIKLIDHSEFSANVLQLGYYR